MKVYLVTFLGPNDSAAITYTNPSGQLGMSEEPAQIYNKHSTKLRSLNKTTELPATLCRISK